MASIAPKYQVRLRDQSGVLTAIFDDWVDMEFTKEVNNIGSYKFQINGEDARRSLFELDGQVEIWRQVAGCGLGWYKEFEGFHRLDSRSTDKEGNRIFVSDGVGLNDLLARSIIAYKAGTIRADKNAPAETVMKEYVDENCGPTADDTVVGRLYQGGFPNFSTEADLGRGPVWAGSRAFENLLDVLRDIANVAEMDFQIVQTSPANFSFFTYVGQLGSDRTYTNMDVANGLNGAGNYPVMFSIPTGTIQDIEYIRDRLAEANVVIVLGPGEGSTQDTLTRSDGIAIAASPWNRREVSRPGGDQEFDYQREQLGDEILKE